MTAIENPVLLQQHYAIAQRVYVSSYRKTADGQVSGWWWLRSPIRILSAAIGGVYDDGSLANFLFSDDSISVHPALWVNLESGIF